MRRMTFGQRFAGAIKLDAATFEEIEANLAVTRQALLVVVLSSMAPGIGAGLIAGPLELIKEAIAALVGWVMWAIVTYFIGTRLLPEPQTRSDIGELLRVIGFAFAPGVFNLFGFIPLIGGVVRTVVAVWILVSMVVAVRQALDYTSTGRAFVVVLIGWVLFVLITVFIPG
jgi:hypothetical protein